MSGVHPSQSPPGSPCPPSVASQAGRPALLQARGLTRVYRTGEQEVLALDRVDLDVAQGEFLVLLGPSGSGKSTLLNILGGLDLPTRGSLSFAGHRLDGASDDQLTAYRREHVGFVFQFYNLIPSLTARENVALVAGIATHPMPVDEALAEVDLLPRADHFPSELSGGEQQRVAIARAIVKRPDLLLCDEPTGALDIHAGRRVLQAIARINEELGTTAIVITHNAVIAQMADRVLHLAGGRIARVETPASKCSAEALSW